MDHANDSLQRLAALYLVVLVIIAGVLALLLLPGDWLGIQLLFLLVVALTPWHQSSAILLFMVLSALLFREVDNPELAINEYQTSYWPIPTACLILVFLVVANRFCITWKSCCSGSIRKLIASARDAIGGDQTSVDQPPNRLKHEFVLRLIKIPVLSLAIVAFAWFVLAMVPEDGESVIKIRMRPREYRAIMIAVLIAGVGIVCWHLMSAIYWRFLSPSQARIFMRSNFSSWLEPDTRTIARHRRKRASKAAAKSLKKRGK